MEKYKNIVFDIGNVILNFDIKDTLERYTNSEEDRKFIFDNIFNSPEWAKYNIIDTGYITLSQAISIIQDRTNHEKDELIQDYMSNYDIFSYVDQNVLNLINDLKNKGYKIYLLSNINDCTTKYIRKTSNLFDLVDGAVLSYEVNAIKPYKRIYEILLKKYNLDPAETIFIDDKLSNIETGKKLGMKSIKVLPNNYENIVKEINKVLEGKE